MISNLNWRFVMINKHMVALTECLMVYSYEELTQFEARIRKNVPKRADRVKMLSLIKSIKLKKLVHSGNTEHVRGFMMSVA